MENINWFLLTSRKTKLYLCLSRLLSFIIICLFTTQLSAQEQINVTGTITEKSGETIIGASVVVSGTTTGVISNIDGVYTISAPSDGTLEVSYVGYAKQSIPIQGRKTINIVLQEDVTQLEEYVVVGYATQRKSDVTGAVAKVNMDELLDKPVPSLSSALDGEIPGVSISSFSGRPGDAPTISIRQSFNLSKDGVSAPLIVIDDVVQVDPATGNPSYEAFHNLDPSEVENMTVLKDASAAIYGARAAQGAIVIQTKKGKAGRPQISYSGKFQWKDAISHAKTMNAYEHGVFVNRFLRQDNPNRDVENFFTADELEQMKSIDYNWLDKAWKSAFTMQHNVSVSGGTNSATYFANLGFYDQGANLGRQDYQRWNFRAGADIKVINNLKLSATVSGNSTTQEKSYSKSSNFNDGGIGSRLRGEQADYGILLHMPRYIPWSYNIEGKDYWVSPAYGPHRIAGNQNVSNQPAAWNYFATEGQSFQENKNFSYTANFSLTYDMPFLPGLSVSASYSRSETTSDGEQAHLQYMLARSTNSNKPGSHLYGESTNWDIRENTRGARVVYSSTLSKSEQMNFFIRYNQTFGDHTVGGLFSIERSEGEGSQKRLFYENPISGGYNGTFNTAGTLIPDHSYRTISESGSLSYLGRLNYSYGNRYMAEFIFRADASTKFAPENYWGFFPGISAGWVASNEEWFKESKVANWLTNLKVRLSFGITGKDNIRPWRWMQLFGYSQDKGMGFGDQGGQRIPGLTPGVSPNRDIKWDQTRKYNFGLDLGFFDNRLTAGFDFYFDQTRDMLTDIASEEGIPITVGGAISEANYASINAWGSEISINWSDKIGEVDYSIGMHTSFFANKWKKQIDSPVDYPSKNINRVGGPSYHPVWGFKVWKGNNGDGILRTDEDIDAYWNYLTELAKANGNDPSYLGIRDKSGIKKGMLAYQDLGGDLNPDGTINGPNGEIKRDEDFAKLLSNPKSYGITTKLGLGWKGIDFRANISTTWNSFAQIDFIKQGTGSQHLFWSHASFLTDMFDPDDNPNGKYPSLAHYSSTGEPSDFWKISGFRCVIKNITIGYTIPKHLTEKAGISNVRLSLTGDNLWDLYNPYPKKYRNMYDSYPTSYPTLRTWSLGVNLTF